MKTKKAKTRLCASKIKELFEGRPHGVIDMSFSWVGLDCTCECGKTFSIEGRNWHHVKCPSCGRTYLCNDHIELIELEVEPESRVIEGVIE